jgi:translation initiation factor IF-3
LIDENGEQLGIMETIDALRIAEERGLDLVEIAPNLSPPTCRLMDYGKFKYQQKKKGSKGKKTVQRRKEIKLRPKIGQHDLDVKLGHARGFIAKGHKVLVTMVFRGRETMHLDLGKTVLDAFAKTLEDVAKIEQAPLREGRNKMNMVLAAK